MLKTLAINGGRKSVKSSIAPRRQFSELELRAVEEVFKYSWDNDLDFGYQGYFEKQYMDSFCQMQGGGFADAVSSGTAAMFVAISALNLKPEDEIILPPVTDPGGTTPAIFSNHKIRIADSEIDSHQIDLEKLITYLSPDTKLVVLVHVSGIPLEMGKAMEELKARGIYVIEDCSHAHGATYKNKKVGTFGDIAVFSTMFSKNHSTGGCGGIVYTQNKDLYNVARVFADRGKPFYAPDFKPKEPSTFLQAGFNFHQDEISCAIGNSTLKKLPFVIQRRSEIVNMIRDAIKDSPIYTTQRIPEDSTISPFFTSLKIDTNRISVSKEQFCLTLSTEGVPINPRYDYVVADWPWIRKYLPEGNHTPNASRYRDESFNILFHEKFTDENVNEIIDALRKVEKAYIK